MKKYALFVLIALFSLGACKSIQTTGNGGLPPGQAKKITGEKSAKAYAPGQQKAKGRGGA
ncbi:quinol oxidase subunit 4 [Robiginitalea sp. SC105]|uniref:quinol oxidase subunit 4 n=1 Tax=Robiginitalea sp. SC105 TaxID=2762332 RepID=UPI0016398F63|nr:quinol oxidase subunit 4 [Robiginitalea sp. SC105]MBC2839389.1 quinol oxidase subunit 4 [Robiginitalea sp. SC105]